MIRVTVGDADREFSDDIDEQWINQQIVRQRGVGAIVGMFLCHAVPYSPNANI